MEPIGNIRVVLLEHLMIEVLAIAYTATIGKMVVQEVEFALAHLVCRLDFCILIEEEHPAAYAMESALPSG